MKYYKLVKWPESQEYMEREDVFLCNEPDKVGEAAYFVPIEEETEEDEAEKIYQEWKRKLTLDDVEDILSEYWTER